jgi:hypothetical protein
MENTQIFTRLKDLMKTEPEMRKPDQIQEIELLLLNFPFFQKLKRDFHVNNVVDCAIYFTYDFFKTNSMIFESGQYANKFLVLLNGEVSIFRDNLIIRKYSEGPIEECCLSERRKYDNSALASEDCHIICVDYQIYAGIFMAIREKRRIAMASFLQIQKEFKEWSKAKLMSLSYFVSELEATPGSQIFKIGDSCDKIFIVQDGSVVVKTDKIQVFGVGDVIGLNDLKYLSRRSMCISHGYSTLLYIFKHDYLEALKTLRSLKKPIKIGITPKEKVKTLAISVHSFAPEGPVKVNLRDFTRPISGVSRPSSHNSHRTWHSSMVGRRMNASMRMRNTTRISFY